MIFNVVFMVTDVIVLNDYRTPIVRFVSEPPTLVSMSDGVKRVRVQWFRLLLLNTCTVSA